MATRPRPTADSNEAAAAVLAERVTRLEQDLVGLTTQIKQLDQGQSAINLRIGAVDTALTVLRADMNSNQASSQERVADIKESIKLLSKSVDANTALLTALVAQTATNTADMAATPAGRNGLQQIEDVKSRVKTLEDRMLTSDRESSVSRGEKKVLTSVLKNLGLPGILMIIAAALWLAQAFLHLSISIGAGAGAGP